MAEYIERKIATNVIGDIDTSHPYDDKDDIVEQAIGLIDHIPSADVAPVRHGRWELHYKVINGELIPSDKKHVCSECKDMWETSSKLNYCPNCGAKMDGAERS